MVGMNVDKLKKIGKLIRYHVLTSTTKAGSGHPTTCLSAADLMTVLFYGGFFRYDIKDPDFFNNDRLIFSKGHAAPLFYALWSVAGGLPSEELMTLRKIDSRLGGHPCPQFPYADAATGSLGQGLSIGVGLAINAKYLDKSSYRTFVLLGDSEIVEGSVWEATQIASHYKLDNLIAVLDVNRLGQSRATMVEWDVDTYAERFSSFGWKPIIVDGHNYEDILEAYGKALSHKDSPVIIIAKTAKGKGVSFCEDTDGWHGKTLSEDQLTDALKELGEVDKNLTHKLKEPPREKTKGLGLKNSQTQEPDLTFKEFDSLATRKAYGDALVKIGLDNKEVVVLDAETSNSTYSNKFGEGFPERFFEMFVAEQNMVGTATGLSRMGKIPFVSTFACFYSRAFDQIRMSQYCNANIKYVGSHCGTSIGPDGLSHAAIEDIALFRTLLKSTVLYPSDAVSSAKLTQIAAEHKGIVYLRTTRIDTPILYDPNEDFQIGGSKTLRQSNQDKVTIVAAGVTLHEALKAHETLKKEGVFSRVIDLYSIKPIDVESLKKAAAETYKIVTVEDHQISGGIGEAVMNALSDTKVEIYPLAVFKPSKSGLPEEVLDYVGISSPGIVKKVKEALGLHSPGRAIPEAAKPKGIISKIFLDSGDPQETKEALGFLGFLDGQTTNPSLVAKNPKAQERLESGDKFSKEEVYKFYKKIAQEISGQIPKGSVSVEVYADKNSSLNEVLNEARKMSRWIPNAHIKLPINLAGLQAARQCVKEGIKVNMTLCFTQEQAAAVYSVTKGAKKGDVFLSPFIGRLDDIGINGIDLIKNITRMFKDSDGHVEVLAASIRSLSHLLACLSVGVDIATSPSTVLKEWKGKGLYLPDDDFKYDTESLDPISYKDLDLSHDWHEFDINHELTDKGIQRFVDDWKSLIG